jgi:cyclophilin family peptidyl-prolyl cis-trans isomerase
MKKTLILLLAFCCMNAFAARPKHQYVRIKTSIGECIVLLYNETPLHSSNFLKLSKKHYYDGTLFHRVIKDFMVQGGDPDSRRAKPGALLGEGDVGYTIPAEFRDSLFHKKGVLAAAREDNPEKASSGCQFYIVQGKTFTDQQLDMLEAKRLKHKIPQYQREVYKTLGGTPHLDQNYTVFGEVVQGIDLIDRIAEIQTDPNDRPNRDVLMTITVLKRRAAKRLEKAMQVKRPAIPQTQG